MSSILVCTHWIPRKEVGQALSCALKTYEFTGSWTQCPEVDGVIGPFHSWDHWVRGDEELPRSSHQLRGGPGVQTQEAWLRSPHSRPPRLCPVPPLLPSRAVLTCCPPGLAGPGRANGPGEQSLIPGGEKRNLDTLQRCLFHFHGWQDSECFLQVWVCGEALHFFPTDLQFKKILWETIRGKRNIFQSRRNDWK